MTAKGTGCLEFRNCRLKEVVYIPELSKNLLSVNTITSNGEKVLFTNKDVTVSFNNKEILKGQKLSNGLYQIKMETEEEKETYLTENKELNVNLWHRKLGHVGNDSLVNLLKMSDGIDLSLAEVKEDVEDMYRNKTYKN